LQNPKLLIMDEPTSVLTPQEAEKMFETLRRLATEGVSILYISHKLDEIRALCHKATILRGGKFINECDPTKETAKTLAEMMIGSSLRAPAHHKAVKGGDVRLKVRNLTVPATTEFGISLKDISFNVKSGEVFGIAGVAGNGQIELLSALSGETRSQAADAVTLDGEYIGWLSPNERRDLGLAFVPEDRLGHGSVPEMTLSENAFLSGYNRMKLISAGFINNISSARYATDIVRKFDVRTPGIFHTANSLSGGNLQKFIVGREILQKPDVIIVAHPTWGVDAGAAAFIHQTLIDLAEKGAAVLVISQDLDELFAISNRIAVISEGRLSAAKSLKEITVEEIGLLMGGTHGTGAPKEASHVA
jgi:simple sugar transport system ATP-binding protein